MKKRLTVLLLLLALIVAAAPLAVFADDTDEDYIDLDSREIYYTPASDYISGDCILTSTKNMIRRTSIMNGVGDWTAFSNSRLRKSATIAGLLWNTFKYDGEGLVYSVDSGLFKGKGDKARIKEIENLLKVHPEGIVVHGIRAASTGTHGVLAVQVKNGVIYAADSTINTGLNNKGIKQWKRTTMLNPSKVSKYWYISGVSTSTKTIPSDYKSSKPRSILRIASLRAPSSIKKGKGFSLKGKITSNETITEVTVKILNNRGNSVRTLTRKPNAEKFDIQSIDELIKFGTLAKGSYTYQVTATDASQTLKLVCKQFTIK